MRSERLLLAAVLVLAGCSKQWADLKWTRVPADARLGVEFAQGSPLRTGTFATAWNRDGLYVAVLEDPGFDPGFVEQKSQMRVYRMDPATGQSTKLPDPPKPFLNDDYVFGTPWQQSFLGDGALLGDETSGDHRALVFEQGGWTDVPYPSEIRVADSLVGRPGKRLVIVGAGQAFSWDGKTWGKLPLPAGSTQVVLGPWDDAGLRLVVSTANGVEFPLFDVANRTLLEAGPRVSGAGAIGYPRFQNGTSSDFLVQLSVGTGMHVVHVTSGAATVGAEMATILALDTPGAPLLAGVLTSARSLDHTSLGPFLRVTADGTVVTTGNTSLPLTTTCPCVRETDATCQCLPRSNATAEASMMQESRLNADGSKLAIVFGDTADGVRRYLVRQVAMPFTTSPLDEPFTAR